LGAAATRFLDYLPALMLALLCLRFAELAAGVQVGATPRELSRLLASAIAFDLINLARYLPALFLVSLPLLLIRNRRARILSIGLIWSLLLLFQAGLVQYFLTARVPLGADVFGYSLKNIQKIVSGGASWNMSVIAGTFAALLGLWLVLATRSRTEPRSSRGSTAIFALALLLMVFAPARSEFVGEQNEDAQNLKTSKWSYFLDDSLAYLTHPRAAADAVVRTWADPPDIAGNDGFDYLDPKFPFLHREQTPDALGPHFNIRPGQPPNLVFIVVEGMGRSFSGPGAQLGSFTPHLDQLAEQGLYFENFLAVQGRTFAVLPSLFASLPFGDNGFSMLGERMPAHDSLLSLLKGQGYRLRFYSGFDSDFDNESLFLKRQGVDDLVDMFNFGPGYTRANVWGYADDDLVSRALEGERVETHQPFVSVIKTVTMHSPYTFPDQARFNARFEQRLDQLGVVGWRKDGYRRFRNIYTSILYTDAALGRFFEQARRLPTYPNTIFIVVGDHRLPEIPMATKIDRYHVPLIIVSPLLKAPARIKSVSSHFDLAPSVLAFLASNYGLHRPAAVTWIGSGLDMEPSFRNIHEFPLKQTKTNLVDFVSGTWFLNRDTLYEMSDGMSIEPSLNAFARTRVKARFAAFRAVNDQFARGLALVPAQAGTQAGTRASAGRAQDPAQTGARGDAQLSVRDVQSPAHANLSAPLNIEAVFANAGTSASETFVPLVVLSAEDGSELSESYGEPQRLLAGATVSLRLAVDSQRATPGRYFLSVIASQPRTGKKMGSARHHLPIRFVRERVPAAGAPRVQQTER
jgi:uncharacterized sulfatase